MATQYRSESKFYWSRNAFRGYPCDFGISLNSSKKLEYLYEYVDSYRGPMQFVEVRQKRRKKFHTFDRYRFLATQGLWKMCDGTNVAVYEREPIQRFMRDYYNFGDNSALVQGDKVHVSPEALEELCEPYRDATIRDMFIKVNSPRFNTAVFLAELGETVGSIHLLLKGALGTLLKEGKALKYVKHFALHPEELWLWYRYALVPAMLDIEDFIAAIKPPKEIDRVQDGFRKEWDDYLHVHTGNWWYYQPAQWRVHAEYKLGVGGAMDILHRFDPSPWGTSAHDVLSAAWEIVPFSFIFDWFVNLGDWLASVREIDVSYAQSYATYAIEAKYDFESLNGEMLGENPQISVFRQRRVIELEPPSLPLVDKDWANVLRTVDLISLSAAILKSLLQKRRR